MQWPIGYGYNRGYSKNLRMRYNISERDGKVLAGPIYVFGGPSPPVTINNNVIYFEPARAGGGAIHTATWGKSGSPRVYVYNNLVIMDTSKNTNTSGTGNDFFWKDGKGTWTFDNNVHHRIPAEGFRASINGKAVTSFAGWRSRGFDAAGKNTDPRETGAPGDGPFAYILPSSSPAIDAGRVVTQGFGIGNKDYTGDPAPQGAAYDVGTFERVP